MDKNAEEIVNEIKQLDNNLNGVVVPMLKDTIADYRKIVFKLIIIIMLLIFGIIGVSVYSQTIISKQIEKFNSFSNEMIKKYNDFLSQFEYETEEHVYQETDGNSVINSGINYNE